MPEIRYIKIPAGKNEIKVTDETRRPVILNEFAGRRVKWAKKIKKKVRVMLEGQRDNRGDLLIFDSTDDYEAALERMFVQSVS